MLYNLKNELHKKKAVVKFDSLLKNESVIELTEKKQRSLSQNSYLHVCFGIVAIEHGTTIEDVKNALFKGIVNRDFYYIKQIIVYDINKSVYKSTSQTTAAELTIHLERFRNYCASEYGIYIPTPEEKIAIQQAQIEINNFKKHYTL